MKAGDTGKQGAAGNAASTGSQRCGLELFSGPRDGWRAFGVFRGIGSSDCNSRLNTQGDKTMKKLTVNSLPAIALVLSILSAQPVFAGKPGGSPGGSAVGVVTIDQDKAAAGGITNGDTPGFPVTLSQSGSYRLEGNLTLPDIANNAIHITADNVTIDLNGFTVSGPNVCVSGGSCNTTLGYHGITGGNHTTIFNGTVMGMGGTGITLGRNAHVERVHVQHNGSDGIVTGERSLVTDNTIEANFNYGVWVGTGTLVLRNAIGLNKIGARFTANPAFTGALGLNSFVNNVTAPIEVATVILQPNACIGTGC
jgi:acetyltransferase-like isoleucine patch superfamily enzyme